MQQENRSSAHNPVPLPRPRQQPPPLRPPVATEEPRDAGVYESVSIHYANVQAVREPPEMHRPVPAPRQRAKVMLVDSQWSEGRDGIGVQPNEQRNEPYQNVVIVRPAPAPVNNAPPPVNNAPPIPVTTRAPSIPPLPGQMHNNLQEPTSGAAVVESDGVSIDSADSGGAVGGAGRAGLKYKTSSPADLFKTIGNTTRLLTESIGERMAHKTKKAAHNVRSTGSSLVNWGAKSVGRGTKTGADGEAELKDAARCSRESPDAETTRPPDVHSPNLMQKIKFGSPLRVNSVGTTDPVDGGGDQMTYDIPKHGYKPTNLHPSTSRSSPSTPPSTAPSSHGGSARASSSSMTSSAGATGLFQRNAPASQSLYSRVVPKHARRYGWTGEPRPAARPDQPAATGALVRSSKNKSESNLYESTFYVERPVPPTDGEHLYGKLNIIARPSFSSSSSSYCASVASLNDAGDGGGSEEDNNLPELQQRGKGRDLLQSASSVSPRANHRWASEELVTERRIFSRGVSKAEEPPQISTERQNRSHSWNFYDIATGATSTPLRIGEEIEDEEPLDDDELSHISTPEPVYANDDQRLPIYDQLADMETLMLLKPVPAAVTSLRHDYDEVSIADIIDEFDPLVADVGEVTLEAIFENKAFDGTTAGGDSGNLALIETLLGAESYSRRRIVGRPRRAPPAVNMKEVGGEETNHTVMSDSRTDGSASKVQTESSQAYPRPPQRSDSLLITGATAGEPAGESPVRSVPAKPKRNKVRSTRAGGADRNTASIIIHQNLNLPSGSVENLVELEERLIEPHLSTLDEPVAPSGAEAVDLSYPKTPQTNWFLEEAAAAGDSHGFPGTAGQPFEKQLNVDPVNERESATGKIEKATKPSLPPELQAFKGSGRTRDPHDAMSQVRESGDSPVPSYFEAIGGTEPMFECGLAAMAPPLKSASVATKLLNALKRRQSLNRGSSVPASGIARGSTCEPGAVRTALEMVPKPRLTERLISHKGHVLKFPSGKIGDVLNELSPRSVVLRERIFQTFLDPQQTLPKETLQLCYIMSLQCILQHKFAGEGRLDLHCFEIVLGLPKGTGGGSGGGGGSSFVAGAAMSTNPDLLITSSPTGNVKLGRQSYMFGTHKRSDRNLWMAKVLQSVTDVFGGEGDLLREFQRAGWCYVKKSVSSRWAGAWLLLAKRKMYLYSHAEGRLEELDLRKARCIGAIESEPGTIGNLHVEGGPSLFIDCPPYATLYFIMGSPRETQIWHKVVRQVAHKNGATLHSQQLTLGDIPVLIDKCINFIYAHGSMSEGIYRKSGSLSAVTRILQLLGADAFDVQLTRNEYNEYDVAGALKKFIRELPGSFFGSYAASFVAIGSLSGGDMQLKVDSYRQLLERLPRIEYCTLKKLLGHLAFIASLEKHNRMGVPNLAMIWGSTLLANASQNTVQEAGTYHQQDADVVADLIRLYRHLFPISEDELRKDQLMLAVLQKYHAAAENLSDAVKHSGDLKVWITIDCDNAPEEEGMRVVDNTVAPEDKPQVNVDITPVKTASDVCKELAGKTKYPWYKLTLYEVIANGALIRPIHYSEKVLEIVVRWTYWEEADRKTNYLTLKPTTTLNDVYRTIQKAPVLTPTMELKFADRKTKALRNFQLQLVGKGLVVLKRIEKKDKGFEELLKVDLSRVTAYIGCEPKRDRSSLRWAITLVDFDFKKRTRDSPYIGHIFGGLDFASQILWYSSILYSQYKDDIIPSGDLFF